MATSQSLPGYPNYAGHKVHEVYELVGPSSYSTGGQALTASQFGYGGFDAVHVAGLSLSGTYFGRAQYLPVDAAPSANLLATPNVKIVWYVVATGAEVAAAVDLSGEILRLDMWMI